MNEFLALFQNTAADALAPTEIAMLMLLGFILSQVLAWIYTWTHRSVSYSRSHVQSIILIAIVVTAVMLAIGSNVARAFGLFGALALIRFRTPIKDTKDTVYLFMAVGIGITLGTRNPMLAIYGTLAFATIAIYLAVVRFGDRHNSDALLRFAIPKGDEHESLLGDVLRHYCHKASLVHLRDVDDVLEYAYQVEMFDERQRTGLVTDIGTIPGARDVDLLVQREDEAV